MSVKENVYCYCHESSLMVCAACSLYWIVLSSWSAGHGLLTGLKAIHSMWPLKRCITMTTTRLRNCHLMPMMTDALCTRVFVFSQFLGTFWCRKIPPISLLIILLAYLQNLVVNQWTCYKLSHTLCLNDDSCVILCRLLLSRWVLFRSFLYGIIITEAFTGHWKPRSLVWHWHHLAAFSQCLTDLGLLIDLTDGEEFMVVAIYYSQWKGGFKSLPVKVSLAHLLTDRSCIWISLGIYFFSTVAM